MGCNSFDCKGSQKQASVWPKGQPMPFSSAEQLPTYTHTVYIKKLLPLWMNVPLELFAQSSSFGSQVSLIQFFSSTNYTPHVLILFCIFYFLTRGGWLFFPLFLLALTLNRLNIIYIYIYTHSHTRIHVWRSMCMSFTIRCPYSHIFCNQINTNFTNEKLTC